jgi:hypothetical protein
MTAVSGNISVESWVLVILLNALAQVLTGRHDTQHEDTQHNDIQHNDTQHGKKRDT